MPREVAHRSGGVGLFFGRLEPTEFPEHSHTEIEVALPMGDVAGIAVWSTSTGGTEKHRMSDGCVSVLPSRQPHAGLWEREAHNLIVYLDPGFVLRAARESLRGDSFEIVGRWSREDTVLRGLGLALAREVRTGGTPPALYLESVANVLAVHLLREYGASPRPPRELAGTLPEGVLRRVTDLVGDGLSGKITLSEMAAVAGLSPYHFSRLFKASTGLSPYRYVLARRVGRARELLTRTDLSMPEVAARSGFANQSHMGRSLRRLLGTTPSALRRSRR